MSDANESLNEQLLLDPAAQAALLEWQAEGAELCLLSREFHVGALQELISEMCHTYPEVRALMDALLVQPAASLPDGAQTSASPGPELVRDELRANRSMGTGQLMRWLAHIGISLAPGKGGHLIATDATTGEHSVLSVHHREYGPETIRAMLRQLGRR